MPEYQTHEDIARSEYTNRKVIGALVISLLVNAVIIAWFWVGK